jgi:hypothetical protein
MRFTFRALAVVAATVLMAGCYFDHPLTGNSSKELNSWLLGVWEYKDAKGKVYRAAMIPRSGGRYQVWFRAIGKRPKDTKEWQFEAWVSRVGSGNFLTFRCVQSAGEVPEGAYVFAHYQVLDQNHVALRPLDLDKEFDTSSYRLRVEIRRKLKQNTLLPVEAGAVWTRIAEVYWDPESGDDPSFTPLRFPVSEPYLAPLTAEEVEARDF